MSAKKSEVLFTDYIAEHLSSKGRGGVIVPNGIVATTQNAYVKLRRFLVEDCLVAVVSLPSGVFKPYSGVKTSILFFDKQLARKTQEVLFLKITADGFDLGDKRTPIDANDLPESEGVVKLWLAGKLKEGTESAVAWKAVEKNELLESRDLSLSAEKFLGGTVSNSGDLPIVELGEIVDELESGVSVNSENRETTEGEIGILKTSCVTSGIFQPEQHKAVLSAEVSQVRCPVRRNSIIISRMNTEALVGANAYVAKDFPHLFLPDRLWQTVISRQDVEVRYVQAVLASQASRNRISAMCNGTSGSMKNISKSQLLSLPIPLPPLEEQRRIVAEIEGYQKVLDGARQILAGYRPQVDLDPECESEAFEAICTTITPPKKILATDFGVEGRYPIIDQSQDAIAGYTNDETALIDATLGLVIFGDHTCAVKCVQEPFAQGADGIKIIQTETGLLPKFLFYYLTSHPIEQEGYKRHYSKLKTLEIPVPDLEEQRRIVAELDAEAAQMEAVRSLIPRFEGKIQRVLDRVWGTTVQAV